MAYRGKCIVNPVSGQSIEFILTAKDSQGERLEMISTWNPFSVRPAAHYHPYQEEIFEVLEGELTVVLNGAVLVLRHNESLLIPANAKHAMWNASGQKTVARWQVTPALQTEYLLETGMGLAADRRTNDTGMPGLLQIAIMAREYNKEFRLGKPPYHLQKLVFGILAPLAVLFGRKASYPEYID